MEPIPSPDSPKKPEPSTPAAPAPGTSPYAPPSAAPAPAPAVGPAVMPLPPVDPPSRYPAIMEQLDQIQKKQTSWTSAILMLIVSLSLFVGAGAGAWNWSWETLAIIVGVLFVHEAGHYAAMKVFHYRNVRMFFIPFFGAAVSGQHYHAPGWKKIVVSLMGPLPGVLIGAVLCVLSLRTGDIMLRKIAVMALVLNGFQLLPVLPLDGGRVVQEILFSRNRFLDALFHVLAAVVLIGLGVHFEDRMISILGAFMAISIPASYRLGKVVSELRREGFTPWENPNPTPPRWPGIPEPQPGYPFPGAARSVPPQTPAQYAPPPFARPAGMPPPGYTAAPMPPAPPTPESAEPQSIPQAAAEAIIDRILPRFTQVKGNKQIAELTLRVYENVVARPPGIAASIGFLFLHGATIAFAVIVFALLYAPAVATPHPKLTSALVLDPQAVESWPSSEPSGASSRRGRGTFVATYAASDQARRAFEALKAEPKPPAALVLFGQTVLLSLPASDWSARTLWSARLKDYGKDVAVKGGGQQVGLTLTFRASSPVETAAIESELDGYLMTPETFWLIPPWAGKDVDRRTDDERARHTAARAMFVKLDSAATPASPKLEALDKQMQDALAKDDKAAYQRLSGRRQALLNQLRVRELEQMAAGETDAAARDLAKGYIAIIAAEAPATAESAEEVPDHGGEDFSKLAPLMGRLRLTPGLGQPLVSARRYSGVGTAERLADGRLSLTLMLEDGITGVVAVAKWLAERGCTDFTYELDGMNARN